MASTNTNHKNLKMALQLIGLFIVILIASFVSNALIIIGVNVYYHATIHDTQQAADAISAALNSIPMVFVILLLQNAAFVFVAWLFLTKIDKEKFSLKAIGLGFRNDMSKLILAGLLLDLVLFLPLMAILVLAGWSSFISFGTASYGISTILLSIVLMAIGTLAVGFGEEILFRGYVQNMLTKKYGILIALPLASAFFVLVHILPKFMTGQIELLYFLSVFPIALTLGYIFYVTRSLWACVAFHALEDFFALFAFGDPTSGMPALVFLTAPKDLIVSGVKLGSWGDMVGMIVGVIIFLAVVAYFRYAHNKTVHPATSTA